MGAVNVGGEKKTGRNASFRAHLRFFGLVGANRPLVPSRDAGFDQLSEQTAVVLVQRREHSSKPRLLDVAAERVSIRVVLTRQRAICAAQLTGGEVRIKLRPERDQRIKRPLLPNRQLAGRSRGPHRLDRPGDERRYRPAGRSVGWAIARAVGRGSKLQQGSGEQQRMGMPVCRGRRRRGSRNGSAGTIPRHFLLEHVCESRTAWHVQVIGREPPDMSRRSCESGAEPGFKLFPCLPILTSVPSGTIRTAGSRDRRTPSIRYRV
jgi:hypothetical protein